MKHRALPAVALAFACVALPAQAACFADYKAKQDNPLRLHYGVSEIPEAQCSQAAASAYLAPRLAAAGWQLLNIVSLFDESGLDTRKGNAGDYFLRF